VGELEIGFLMDAGGSPAFNRKFVWKSPQIGRGDFSSAESHHG
jgi:hypothetical protein